MNINTLQEFAEQWQDNPVFHQQIHQYFSQRTDKNRYFKKLRDYVEQNCYGFGERSFYYMWYLIAQDLDDKGILDSGALEIGVHRGQTIALWQLLGIPNIIGLSPMNGADGHDTQRNYYADIQHLQEFVEKMTGEVYEPALICRNYSQGINPVLTNYHADNQLAILYIDGGHSYEETWTDIRLYAELVKVNGIMVIDDSANNFKIPHGLFAGILTVSAATDILLPPFGTWPGVGKWEHLGNVVHNRIFRRIN